MNQKLHDRITVWQVLLFGSIVVWLCACIPGIGWSETADSPSDGQDGVQQEEKIIRLEDGSVIELTEATVVRKGKRPDEPELWSIPADKPRLPLMFANRQGEELFLFFTRGKKHYGEFHAIRVADGQEQWKHSLWSGHSVDSPVTPIFVKPWIYLGRGPWLEKMNPEDGTIVERYPVREVIQALKALPGGALEVQVETSSAGTISLRFQEGQFHPHIVASGYLPANTVLFNRAGYMMEDFVGTLNPSEYTGYLDLHRIKKVSLSPKSLVQWRAFQLKEAETVYQKATQEDLANPYFPLYLALAVYYQNRQTEAEAYIQDALKRSALFWEESLRLGSICESLRLTAWADAFYEQGTTRYFQEVPAPPYEASLNEVLTFFLQRQSSTLFANGQADRALHVLEVRRQLFPYTEGDNLFSRKYANWLQRKGEEEKAFKEKQRTGQTKLIFDFIGITPLSFISFWIASILFLIIVILKNDIQAWYELGILVLVFGATDAIAILDLFTRLSIGLRTLVHIVGILGYISLIAFFRRRKTTSALSQGYMLLLVTTSSYVVLFRGMLPAYYLGYQIHGTQLGGKVAETLFILGFFILYFWSRRNLKIPPLLRHFKLVVLGLPVFLGWGIWLHYWASTGMTMVSFPVPWIDRGHPNWVVSMDRYAERAVFQKRNIQFLQALVHQLNGDTEFAREIYTSLSKDTRALNNLGVILSNENPEAAQTYFEQTLQHDPDFSPALYNLGVITKNRERIEQAQALEGWKPRMYQQYAPNRLWIAMPPLQDWAKTIYWSQGGFWVKGFLELVLRFAKPEEFFQIELQHLSNQ